MKIVGKVLDQRHSGQGRKRLTFQASAEPPTTAVRVGLSWDVRATTGAAFYLDASTLVCGENKRVLSDAHLVFYNNPISPGGSSASGPDNQDGTGDGDDEFIEVNLAAVPPNVGRIVFPVSNHDADVPGQSFGQVQNAYIRGREQVQRT